MLDGFARWTYRMRERIDALFEDAESTMLGWVRSGLRRRRVRKTLPDPVSEQEHKQAARSLESGREYYNKKKYKKALKHFQKAAAIDGRYGLAYYYLGLAMYKTDRLRGARAAWQRAIDVDPESEAADRAREKLGNDKLGVRRKVKVMEFDSESRP